MHLTGTFLGAVLHPVGGLRGPRAEVYDTAAAAAAAAAAATATTATTAQ